MRVGIAIDSWKLTIFDRRLTKAGFSYTKHPGVSAGTLLLTVDVDAPGELQEVIISANQEAARTGMN